ncbi:chondroitin synthase [Geobacter sp. OR-1]|uniref:glycosyltransferase family 2 protein n=1 Tax=Geobacter sp. OR-1 TaxID=1266765 RepID=UPI0005443595|nr:glycosyltransferase family 2 protein [Geobacter sp. OR-1]GAM09746.1 chondroitin synthase [Geobacter sp. OR-1]
MTSLPKISIVTPSFNQGRFIEKTILSVIEQDYPNLEYIIIDGGSTDESVEIIKKYEKHLVYWVSEPDRGQSHAINKGFDRATGEIFGWLNSDDWYHPGALNAVAEAFTANPDAGAVVGGGDYVDEGGMVIVRTVPSVVTVDTICTWFDSHFWQPSCFFTNVVWGKCGPLDESLDLAMDIDLWLKIAKEFTFSTIEEILSSSLRHATAKTVASSHLSDMATLKLVLGHCGAIGGEKILNSYTPRLLAFAREYQATITELNEKNIIIAELHNQLEAVINSKTWKSTAFVRKAINCLSRAGHKSSANNH